MYHVMCAITKFRIRINLAPDDLTYYALKSQKAKNINSYKSQTYTKCTDAF